jgi:hypothetical protein
MRIKKRKRHRHREAPEVVVEGDYSWGGAFGTKWITAERCSGTFTQVLSGVVRVHDKTRDRTVDVRAGHSYLAPHTR